MNRFARFRVGAFDCLSVSDGSRAYPSTAFFANAPAEALAAYGLPAQTDTPFNCLLVEAGERRVLVDTGIGPGVAATGGHLISNLAAAGVTADMIDTVILTHGHADHAGGLLTADGQPAFPNAMCIVTRTEWDFWMGDEAFRPGESRQNRTRDVLAALSGRVRLVEMDDEVRPGIRLVPAPGHTPGNVCVEVESDGERLLFVPDVFAHRLHLERMEWTIIADVDPAQAVATRRRLLARLAAEQTLALGYHMAAPGLGRVQARGEAFVWTAR